MKFIVYCIFYFDYVYLCMAVRNTFDLVFYITAVHVDLQFRKCKLLKKSSRIETL